MGIKRDRLKVLDPRPLPTMISNLNSNWWWCSFCNSNNRKSNRSQTPIVQWASRRSITLSMPRWGHRRSPIPSTLCLSQIKSCRLWNNRAAAVMQRSTSPLILQLSKIIRWFSILSFSLHPPHQQSYKAKLLKWWIASRLRWSKSSPSLLREMWSPSMLSLQESGLFPTTLTKSTRTVSFWVPTLTVATSDTILVYVMATDRWGRKLHTLLSYAYRNSLGNISMTF